MMNRRKMHTFLPVFSAVWMFLLTGCWDRIEINDRAFVTVMFVDKAESGDFEVSLGFPLANRLVSGLTQPSGGNKGNPYTIVTKTGESIPVAIRKIRSDLSREIDWGHNRIIIVGMKMAESGLWPVMDFVLREPDFHTKAYVMVSPKKGKDIAKLTPVFERFPSEVLREFARQKVTLDTSVKDFLEAESVNGDIITGMLTIGETEMLSEKGKKSTWVGTDGAAMFKHGKMIGTVGVEEMRAAIWLKGKMKSSMIIIKSPTDGKTMSFIVLNSRTKINPVVKGDQIQISIHIQADDDILSTQSDADLTDPAIIDKIERLLSKQLSDRIYKLLEKTQQEGADVFQFGQRIDWKYPKLWTELKDNWEDRYKNVQFSVKCDIKVSRPGAGKNPIWIQETRH